ncbi:protein LONGIFOLIA 1-like [Telopea speciosissima]|uniref:protein LONGIFOLIA 1-like n=1 Tax=Telopea speciosissima TaxID=54955 RepID=UPI001CC67D70|nr:protein LONGIFOLIA 1-like [Telopea speciosissima]XP_043693608.1 protein LONGIFOLIA 1-like [Telopea speciosissima]
MMTGLVHDQNLEKQIEKQMGCMAGFLQLFDRHQILSGKRFYSNKRLTPSPAVDSTSQSEKSVGSSPSSREVQQQPHRQELPQAQTSPECTKPTPGICSPVPEQSISVESQARTPLPFQVFEYKEGSRSSWKFKDAPRLSLDSRASFDGKGSLRPREIRTNAAILSATRCDSSSEATLSEDNEKQLRSPSVIARLMGLEALPDSAGEAPNKAELRRSASESRVSRDLLQFRFVDGNNFQQKQTFHPNSGSNVSNNAKRDNAASEGNKSKVQKPDSNEFCIRKPKTEAQKPQNGGLLDSQWKSQQQRKSYFDSQDFFPEPKQRGSLYGEIEKRLKMRGIDEPEKDLETLKQILEALQLKGLLHSKRPMEQIGNRNFVNRQRFYGEESPVVVMKPSHSPVSINKVGRTGTESPPSSFRSRAGVRRNLNLAGETLPPVIPRRDRPEIDRNLQRARNSRSPDRNDSGVKSPSSLAKRRPLSIQTQRRGDDSVEQRRSSPVHSPKISAKKVGSEHATSRSPRNRKPVPEVSPKERISKPVEYESSAISECSISTSSQVDMELQIPKMEEYKEGRTLLERCDKLLHNISEMTGTELQPSPVSVLDSSFYKDDSPSPIMKRCIDFKDESVAVEEENWSLVISPVRLKREEERLDEDSDFLYVSEILRASKCLPEDTDVFLLLEKQRYKSKSSSRESMLHRKLVFDTISEILDSKKQLPPWEAVEQPTLKQIWSEFKRVRERDPAVEDLFEIICGMLRKDMAVDTINGWEACHVEISEEVLSIERSIFKDLVAETIRDLAALTGKNRAPLPRRKLVF